MKTTREIAAYLGCTQQSVNRYVRKACDAENIDVSAFGTADLKDARIRTFSESEVELILKYAPEPKRESEQVVACAITVESGNHQIVVAPPKLPKTYSLEGLRQSDSIQIDDPLAVAAQFCQVADQLEAAMRDDIDQRERKLQQTRQAKEMIAAKAQELRLEQRLYQERTRVVDTTQSEETKTLQEALSALQPLGKPEGGQSPC